MLNAVAADAWVATARRGACLFTGRDAVREVPMKVLFADTACIFYIWYLEYWNYICILECSEIYGRALHTSSRSGLDMVTAHRLIQNEPPGRPLAAANSKCPLASGQRGQPRITGYIGSFSFIREGFLTNPSRDSS